jgi:hypothetical protein
VLLSVVVIEPRWSLYSIILVDCQSEFFGLPVQFRARLTRIPQPLPPNLGEGVGGEGKGEVVLDTRMGIDSLLAIG